MLNFHKTIVTTELMKHLLTQHLENYLKETTFA